MKKILSLALFFMAAFAVNADAQQRKTWDFSKGISDETLENLIADPNWTVSYNDDGTFKEAVDGAKMSGELQANGVVIEELRGLTMGTGGLQAASNYIIRPSIFRFSRTDEQVILRVVPGQTITIKAKSANSTANNRGFKGDDNMTYVSGPADGICLGGNLEAEGRDVNGNFTLVWKVNADAEVGENDSLDVTITCGSPAGGLDVTLIQIDEGDPEPSNEIAYLYDSSYPEYTFGSEDPNYDVLANAKENGYLDAKVVAIDIANNPAEVSVDSLYKFKLVAVSPAISSTNPYVNTIKGAISYVPMLNFSPDLYETWGYGTAKQTETNILTIGQKAQSSELFNDDEGKSYIVNGQVAMYDEEPIRGYEATTGSLFAKDSVWAKAGDVNAIHVHNASRNAYMLLPYTFPTGDLAESFQDIVINAANILMDTKMEVTPASKPAVTQEFRHLYTTVKLGCSTKGARIFYTTDGTEPTTESTEYQEPFIIDTKGVTVKAIATAEGYLTSNVGEAAIEIHELNAVPTITCNEQDGATEVTLTAADPTDVIYFNFTGSNNIAESEVYTEPMTFSKHGVITAFTAERGEYLQSDAVSKRIVVNNEKVRMDVIGHFDANKTDWGTLNVAAYSYYDLENIIGEEKYTDIDGLDSIVYVYKPAENLTVYNPGNGWEFKTYGQAGLIQNNTIMHNVLDFDAYNPQTAWDDSEQEATSYCVQFGGRYTNKDNWDITDPVSACIQSTDAYQGPFDVVTYISGYNATTKLYVSADTLNADGWTELGDMVGGSVKGTATNGKDGSARIWRKNILSYEGTDKVFVKLAAANGTAMVFDIYIKNDGEQSQAYREFITGIEDVNRGTATEAEVVRTLIYSINGAQLSTAGKGINIIKEVYSDGSVKTKKVVVR